MKILEYKAPNPLWDVTELQCEKTGVSILKLDYANKDMKDVPPCEYRLKDTEESIIESSVIDVFSFEIIKKLLI